MKNHKYAPRTDEFLLMLKEAYMQPGAGYEVVMREYHTCSATIRKALDKYMTPEDWQQKKSERGYSRRRIRERAMPYKASPRALTCREPAGEYKAPAAIKRTRKVIWGPVHIQEHPRYTLHSPAPGESLLHAATFA